MPFTTPVKIEPIREDGLRTRWRVSEALNFYDENFKKNYVVPAGSITDLASGILPAASAAAIVHDHLYDDGERLRQVKDRSEADLVFLDAMLDTGVPLWRAWSYYFAVRAWGWRFYKS